MFHFMFIICYLAVTSFLRICRGYWCPCLLVKLRQKISCVQVDPRIPFHYYIECCLRCCNVFFGKNESESWLCSLLPSWKDSLQCFPADRNGWILKLPKFLLQTLGELADLEVILEVAQLKISAWQTQG